MLTTIRPRSRMKTHWTDAEGDEIGPDSKVVDCCRCHATILASKSYRTDGRPSCLPCYTFMLPLSRHGHARPRPSDPTGDQEDAFVLDAALSDFAARLVEDQP